MTPEERADNAIAGDGSDNREEWFIPVGLENRIAAAIREAVAEEIEACAAIADRMSDEHDPYAASVNDPGLLDVAAAIRARKS